MERRRNLLIPFSWLYAALMVARNQLYDRGVLGIYRVGCPVISVGNITTGGTGKTPFVEYLLGLLQEMRARTVLLSRGYGRLTRGTVTVSDGKTVLCGPSEGGDEPIQVARKFPRCPVVVDGDRVRGARFAVREFDPDVIVLDDGFQHRRLHRDLDVVLLDGSRDVFTMPMLPAGNRREPLSSLRRADFIVRNRCRTPDGAGRSGEPVDRPSADMKYILLGFRGAEEGEPGGAERFRGDPVTAFCGVGNPESFRSLLAVAGLKVASFLEFPDHHRYTAGDIDRISREFRGNGSKVLVTTEKDAVRMGAAASPADSLPGPLFSAVIAVELTKGRNDLIEAVKSVGARRPC